MANYYVLLTNYGKQVIANAHTATPIQLIDVVLGDANNQPYMPESRLDQTTLVHETARVPVTKVTVVNANTAEVTAIVPSDVGGFNIHEIGIVDITGQLIYIGNFHGGYRPVLTEGAGGDMEIVFSIVADNLANVVIESDPTVVTASKAWVNERFSVLFNVLFPIGYPYWCHHNVNPKPFFDALLGYETFWRRLEGVQMVAVQDNDAYINQPMQLLGQKGLTDTAIATRPHAYPLYTSYLFERYDPDMVVATVWRVIANKHPVPEGETVRLVITANNIPDGQFLNWTITEGDNTTADNIASGTTILSNGEAVIDYQTTADDNIEDPNKTIHLTVSAPADLDLIIPITDKGHNETVIHISQSTYDGIVLDEYFKSQAGHYPTATDTVRFIIDAGVDIVAPSTLRGAIESGDNWTAGSKIIIENHGRILGRGGDGGRSAYFSGISTNGTVTPINIIPAKNGSDGGTAVITSNLPIQIDNYNLIAGGGGGGGGMGMYQATSTNFRIGGGGAGGGAPLGKGSPNEGTYLAYLNDPTITYKKVPVPSDPRKFSYVMQVNNGVWQNETGARAVFGDMLQSSDFYDYDDSYTPPNNSVGRSFFFAKDTNGNYITDMTTAPANYIIDNYSLTTNTSSQPTSYPLKMAQNATVASAGQGGSNIAPDAMTMVVFSDSNSYILNDIHGGTGGECGESGQSGIMNAFYNYDVSNGMMTTVDKSTLKLFVDNAQGGQAGYIYQGNVTINNINGGATKGRMPN